MTTETTPTIELELPSTAGAERPKSRRTTTARSEKPARSKSRGRRPKADHRPLKVMLTAGAFLATWMGTGWMAQQDAIAAAQAAQANQPAPVTVAYVDPDGTVTERTLDLQPIPQVVVSSNSSK